MESKLQELTQKIYQDGIEKANNEAKALLDSAKKEAEQILAEAKKEAEKEVKIREAEGEAEAILKIQEATAQGLEKIKAVSADESVIRLRSLETLERMSDGQATKIIVPSELQGLAGTLAGLSEVVDKKK